MDLVAITTRRVPSRIDSGRTEVSRELLARKTAAVTHVTFSEHFVHLPQVW